MKTYYLKCKDSQEVINKKEYYSIELAIEYFSKVKKLKPNQLLSIYFVDDKQSSRINI
jgi:ssRNA-specific RNase YbeY (16S rRNA maturation enzyme)